MSDLLERTLAGLRSALAVSPDNGPLWLQVAELLAELGRKTEATDAAREAARRLAGDERARAEAIIKRLTPVPEPTPDNVVRLRVAGRGDDDDDDDAPGAPPPLPGKVTFADVGGLDALKDTIRMKIVLPFQKPEIFKAYGKRQGGGILMYGPPGCGKTLLARATAGECEAAFWAVAIDDVLDMWFGESEKRLASFFAEARRRAPAVLFFDEVEAIGASRQSMKGTPGRTLVNQLLAEMDGAQGDNERVLIMGATNAPWHVDAALRRPGRFDRVIFVPPPDAPARAEILRLHLRARPVDGSIDLAELAKKTDEYSGADLLDLVERATEAPLKEALRSGVSRPIGRADFLAALKVHRPTTREWFSTAKNYATFANTGGLYDDLVEYLKGRK